MARDAAAFVAVDLGASGGKVSLAVFDGERFSLAEAHRFANGGVRVWAGGVGGQAVEKTYWDDLALIQNIVEGLRRAAAMSPAPVLSIGIDTWGADAGLLNRHGELLSPVHAYRDHRLDAMQAELFERISPRELFDRTGLPSQPWYLINQLHWLVKYRPEMLDLTDVVLPIPSLLEYYLCGAKRAEATWMVVQQLCRVGGSDYDDALLAAAGIPRRILPQVVPPGTTLGPLRAELAQETGLADAKVVAVKAHDTASAYTAAPVRDPARSLIVSSGTWSLVGKLLDEPMVNDTVFENRLANEGVAGDVRLLRNVMGTWPVQQLRDAWGRADGREIAWDALVALAESAPPHQVRVNVDDPALYNPPDMEAAIRRQIRQAGQAEPDGRAALLRAVYEGLAEAVAEANRLIESATGQAHEVVHVVGGGARNALLNQFIADAAHLPVEAGPYEATSIGNILVQAVAAGVADSIAQARQTVMQALPTQRFEPRGSADRRR